MKKRNSQDAKAKAKTKKAYGAKRAKFCKFCVERLNTIDYKDVKTLSSFTPERGKVMPRRTSGVCARHQRTLVVAIKRARNIALLPFTTD